MIQFSIVSQEYLTKMKSKLENDRPHFVLYPLTQGHPVKYKASRKRATKKDRYKYYLFTDDESTLLLTASLKHSTGFLISKSAIDESDKNVVGNFLYDYPKNRWEFKAKINSEFSGIIQNIKIKENEKEMEIEIPFPYGPTFNEEGTCYTGYSKIDLLGKYIPGKSESSLSIEDNSGTTVMRLTRIHIDEFQIELSYPLSPAQGFSLASLFINFFC